VLDVPMASTPRIIAERAFSSDPAVVAILGRAFACGLLEGGVMPVMKHIPGHGCASQDSHDVLPRVLESLAELDERDFSPFSLNVDAIPWAMVAHVVYQAADRDRPASQSATVIAEIIRRRIGFDGVLITDDVGMGALGGTLLDRVRACLVAGNDLVLVCDSDTEMLSRIAERLAPLGEAALARLQGACSVRHAARRWRDVEETRIRLASLLSGVGV
jgi:beta-N-acetylhexosaminidase